MIFPPDYFQERIRLKKALIEIIDQQLSEGIEKDLPQLPEEIRPKSYVEETVIDLKEAINAIIRYLQARE